MMFCTVERDGNDIVWRHQVGSLDEAFLFFNQYYKAKHDNSALTFSAEVGVDGFIRAYATLHSESYVRQRSLVNPGLLQTAKKQCNKFDYDANYVFLIESQLGVDECERQMAEDEAEDGEAE
jgi:hypothetical protein